MPTRVSKKNTQAKAGKQNEPGTCKTCTPCRQKKVKCPGTRPRCDECVSSGHECVYPRDARREPRPSRARLQNLEATVSALLEHMSASGNPVSGNEAVLQMKRALAEDNSQFQDEPAQDTTAMAPTPESAASAPFPTPTASTTTHQESSQMSNSPAGSFVPAAGNLGHSQFDSLPQPLEAWPTASNGTYASDNRPNQNQYDTSASPSFQKPESVSAGRTPGLNTGEPVDSPSSNGLSPCEARVAGVFHEQGRVSSVHGLAGIINPTRRSIHKENISKVIRKGEAAVAASRAVLISNAALQKQRESRIFRQPQGSIDLDGCEPELAKHLMDVHFNRGHCGYLITYRPAIMDSLANGGPWVNKLLLNAIYYNSSLYSDRAEMMQPDGDSQSVGARYYNRVRQLMVDEIDRPSVPTAAGLLLTSMSLVAQGKVSAAWTLSGMAYRMIIDLGCHMMLDLDYRNANDHSNGQTLHQDMEHEMRKRLYWGAYITDVTQSLYFGRSCVFASAEARVPLRLLDSFEELEDWLPYADPKPRVDAGDLQSQWASYTPQPSYNISCFVELVRLMQIGVSVVDMYGISIMQCTTRQVLEKKETIEARLEKWTRSLPEHLKFDPEGNNIPPPHLISPHTTFHVLKILLYRAFMEEGHLRRHSDLTAKKTCEEKCIASALMIKKYVQAYRDTFTLRRAPFLLSYAIYSAVAIILPQERHERGNFTDIISFFWTCLGELQRGCNSGLQKPLSILRDMLHEFQLSVKEQSSKNSQQPELLSLDQSFFPQLPLMGEDAAPAAPSLSQQGWMASYAQMQPSIAGSDGMDLGSDLPTPGTLDFMFMNDQEWNMSQNSLYGLFAPDQTF